MAIGGLEFGMQTGDAKFDYNNGIMAPYYLPGKLKDQSHHAVPYLGDMSGFGYNYGYIGGDFHIVQDFTRFPNCEGATTGSEMSSPSTTIVSASSAFHKEAWLEGGDGKNYDFGFIDPPEIWEGNPNVDFRHFGEKKIDLEDEEVETTGRAVFLFADGSAKSLTRQQVPPEYFRRDQTNP